MADAYAPAYELSGEPMKVTGGYVVGGLLDQWFGQSLVPVSVSGVGRWAMTQAGYVPPRERARPGREYPLS